MTEFKLNFNNNIAAEKSQPSNSTKTLEKGTSSYTLGNESNFTTRLRDFASKGDLTIPELLVFASEEDCSDLYIVADERPFLSKFGMVYQVYCDPIDDTKISDLFKPQFIKNELKSIYTTDWLLDTSIELEIPHDSKWYSKMDNAYNMFRYRASFGRSRGRKTGTFRMIKAKKPTFNTINYNPKCVEALQKAYSKSSGICYESGPTGSGKSTTMAACINSFTQPGGVLDNKVIITLEDPIENIFDNTPTVKIMQKELGQDFKTFPLGIKAALREHPNIIIVGECRDKPVICAAIEASRTGHVTTTTFHAPDVPGTLNRLLYHLDNDLNLCMDLITQMNIILSQKMLKSNDRYIVDTQFLLFDEDYVIRPILRALDNSETNLTNLIRGMITDPNLQELGISKDWDYPELH